MALQHWVLALRATLPSVPAVLPPVTPVITSIVATVVPSSHAVGDDRRTTYDGCSSSNRPSYDAPTAHASCS